ncbi:MAG: hypothetical protein ACN4E2_06005 [Nitrospinota bacterium]
MRYINEDLFLLDVKDDGIVKCDNDRSISFSTDDYFGFDFTNLAYTKTGVPSLATTNRGDSIEKEMLEALFNLLNELDQFPVSLIALEDKWVDEECLELDQNSAFTPEEKELLIKIDGSGASMDVVEFEEDELEDAIRLLYPQLVLRQNRCAIIGRDGLTLSTASYDDEVSFNTLSKELYDRARSIIREQEDSFRFEVVWIEAPLD